MLELMEGLLAESSQSSDGLRARAAELRQEAKTRSIKGERDAALALADRYEVAAASRLAGSRP